MNARLLAKTLRRPAARPVLHRQPAAAPAQVRPLQLLGDGLDALFVPMRPDVIQPTPDQRLLRYLRAKAVCRTDAGARLEVLRRSVGEAFQAAWAQGRRPDLRFGKPIRLRPVGVR